MAQMVEVRLGRKHCHDVSPTTLEVRMTRPVRKSLCSASTNQKVD